MAKKRSKTKKAPKMSRPRKPKPKQDDLPGMEDRAIKPLEEAVEAYADIRDQRIALNQEEADLKAKVLKLMHQHDKTVYHRNGITITVVNEQESVRVRVKSVNEETDESVEINDESQEAVG